MPAYVVATLSIHDPERFAAYREAVPEVIARYGGRYLARGGETITLEGSEAAGRVVILEFPSLEAAQAFYESEEYAPVKALREPAATATLIAVDGLPATPAA